MKENATIYDYVRMCKTFSQCLGCPLEFERCNFLAIKKTTKKQLENINAIVSNWCKGHPVKTRQDKFLEMFPNARTINGIIDICPRKIGSCLSECGKTCSDCRKSYWLAEVEE